MLQSILADRPELGITSEIVNGRLQYRHRAHPALAGGWMSRSKVEEICNTIPSYEKSNAANVAEALIKAIEQHNLGNYRLWLAQWKYIGALLTPGAHNYESQEYAESKAREMIRNYSLEKGLNKLSEQERLEWINAWIAKLSKPRGKLSPEEQAAWAWDWHWSLKED